MRRPASRVAIGIAAVISVSMKPGATALTVCALGEHAAPSRRRSRSCPPSRSRSSPGPRLPAMPFIEDSETIRPCARSAPLSSSASVIRSWRVRLIAEQHVPLLVAHARERAVARDAGVVDDDVDAAVALRRCVDEPRRRVRRR